MADSVSGERLTPEDEKLKESWRQQATKMREEELPLLLRDADLLPKEPSLQYRSGLALYMADRNEEALERIRRAVDLSPEEAQYRTTLVLLLQKMKKFTDAIDALRPLLDRQPDDPGLSQLLRQLQQQAQDPAPTPPIAP
jgi:predicted Zn-dependent protease